MEKFYIEDLPTNPLNANELLGDVVETVTANDWRFLEDGMIGQTKYNQYLSLPDHNFNNLDPKTGSIIFAENERDVVGNFLVFNDGDVMFEFEIEFEEGLESRVSGGELVDLKGKTIALFGSAYTISEATLGVVLPNTIILLLDGPQRIELKDLDFTDTTFQTGLGGGEVNHENIEDSSLRIMGSMISPLVFELQSIKYRLNADAVLGDMFIPPGQGMRQQLDEPAGMLGPWDIVFESLRGNVAKVYLGPAMVVEVPAPPPEPQLKERVICMFDGSRTTQRCYSEKGECSGRRWCRTEVQGSQGEKVQWESTCQGNPTTTIDGRGERIRFNCGPVRWWQRRTRSRFFR